MVDQGPETMFRQTAVTNAYFWFGLGRTPLVPFLRSPDPTSSTEIRYWHGFVLYLFFLIFFFHKRVKIRDICLRGNSSDGSVLRSALSMCFGICAAVFWMVDNGTRIGNDVRGRRCRQDDSIGSDGFFCPTRLGPSVQKQLQRGW